MRSTTLVGAGVELRGGEVHALLTAPTGEPAPELGKLLALAGVAEFPARVKCASLCWHTLNAALERTPTPVSTE